MTTAPSDTAAVPQHLGLILDGNRRWARVNGKSVAEGHRQGYLTLKKVCKHALTLGVSYVSAYVFSTENWKRDKQEIDDIMGILAWVLKHEVDEFHREGVRLRFLGSRTRLAKSLVKAIEKAEARTADNARGTLLLCLDYGGQQELADAVSAIVASGVSPQDVTPDLITQHLYAPDVPPIDFVIRSSGEQRLSNFMLWRAAYSELLFVPEFWPDFDEAALDRAVAEYARRQRRFGS